MQTYLQKQENYIRKLTLKLIISITPEEFIFPNVIDETSSPLIPNSTLISSYMNTFRYSKLFTTVLSLWSADRDLSAHSPSSQREMSGFAFTPNISKEELSKIHTAVLAVTDTERKKWNGHRGHRHEAHITVSLLDQSPPQAL